MSSASDISEQIRAAATRTATAGTARIFSAGREGSPVGDHVGRTEGVADLPKRIARATVHHMTPEAKADIDGKLAEPLEDPEEEDARAGAQAFINAFSTALENVYVGGATYTRVGEGWSAFKGTDRDGPRAADDPLWLLDALLGVRDDVTELGAEEVRGVPTTRYEITIDLASADEQLESGITAPGPRPYRSLHELPAQVWIDDQGLVRRMSYEIAEPMGYWQTTELWDYGLDVDIAVPSPEEITAGCRIDPRSSPKGQDT